jgi:NAD(P)-dependent dehydrogenase (short-subunit alcohol dehydrogenase family)
LHFLFGGIAGLSRGLACALVGHGVDVLAVAVAVVFGFVVDEDTLTSRLQRWWR